MGNSLIGKKMSFSDFIKLCENDNDVNLTHFMVVTSNRILCEYCMPPYEMDSLKLLFSITKSFTSIAIGIAYDMQLLSLTDRVMDFFPDESPPTPCSNLQGIQIQHLLTMSSGIHANTYDLLFPQDNWIKAFLAQDFPHEPGEFYRYSTHASHMLSAIITKVTGLSLEEFLNKYLFHLMDIYEAQWELSPEGLTAGGMGLSLFPYSLAKIAQMLLNNGLYNGIQLISSEYLGMATVPQIIKQDEINCSTRHFSGTEYGYQIHIGKHGYFRFAGAFGQLCLVCPDKNIAFVAFSQCSKMERLLSMIYQFFIDNTVSTAMKSYTPPTPQHSTMAVYLPNAIYEMERNSLGIKFLELSSDNHMKIITVNSREDIIYFDFGALTTGKAYFVKDLQEHLQKYVCCICRAEENLLELCVYYIETPYVVKYLLEFEGDTLQLEFSINVSLKLKDFSVKGVPHTQGSKISRAKAVTISRI
jgi:CubicO group peptidase (beta-lactamase class C family)